MLMPLSGSLPSDVHIKYGIQTKAMNETSFEMVRSVERLWSGYPYFMVKSRDGKNKMIVSWASFLDIFLTIVIE